MELSIAIIAEMNYSLIKVKRNISYVSDFKNKLATESGG